MNEYKSGVVIYTDGACDPNPGPGGWGAILRYAGHEKALSGGAPETTNNRMELQAALAALRALKWPCQVTLYTDSEYLRQGITVWLPKWQRRGWRTSQGKAVQNQDLWGALSDQVERHELTWRWVQAHTGDPLNERADQLARSAIPRPGFSERDSQATRLYTRASCLGSPGPGGWGVVIQRDEALTTLSGGAPQASANQMELEAAIQALSALKEPERVCVYTVSKYLYQGITLWVENWRARHWKTKTDQPVRHKALWMALCKAQLPHTVEWRCLVRTDRPPESDQAAALAAQAAQQQKETLAC